MRDERQHTTYIAQMADLFAGIDPPPAPPADPAPDAPLADRLRPQTLADVVGQTHLTEIGRAHV